MSAIEVLPYPSIANSHYAVQPQHCPYESSISSSASSSVSSVFSADGLSSSQGSISSISSSLVDVNYDPSCGVDAQPFGASAHGSTSKRCAPRTKQPNPSSGQAIVPAELRQNPRRTRNVGANGSAKPPPPLVRQCERKWSFVDSLVDSAAQIVETIWPLSTVALRSDTAGCKSVLPLRVFIQETLRRSRTSYSTLQVALYYLILVKNRIPKLDFTMEQPRESACSRAMQCGRRMFLAALILASKYLQDRNYSSRAWSKISGLSTTEINQNEFAFLDAVNWKLHIAEPVFQRWTEIVLKYTPKPGDSSNGEGLCWSTLIPTLTPDLDVEISKRELRSPTSRSSPARDLFPSSQPSPSPCHTPVPSLSAGPDVSMSSQQTPTDPCQSNNNAIPKTLEPDPRMDNPWVPQPPIPKLDFLPTPQMTPQSTATSTPAASTGGGFDAAKPSIGAALCRANSMTMQRCTVDQRPSLPIRKHSSYGSSCPLRRRSSLARSGSSSSSSPESTTSDVPSLISSQSSWSSSSSSSSSSTSGDGRNQHRFPFRPLGNHLKESRKNLSIATPIAEGDQCEVFYSSPEQLSQSGAAPNIPDLSNFSLGPSDEAPTNAAAQEAAEGLCALSGNIPAPIRRSHHQSIDSSQQSSSTSAHRRCRKRNRSAASEDTGLQENVRHLMATTTVPAASTSPSSGGRFGSGRSNENVSTTVLPDDRDANSFLFSSLHSATADKAAQRATEFPAVTKLPLPPFPGSMKRACYGKDDARAGDFLATMRRHGGGLPPFGVGFRPIVGVGEVVDVAD